MAEQFELLFQSLREFAGEVVAFLPRLLVAVLLLIVGWVVARLVRRLTLKALRLARVDVVAEKAGIEDFLVQGGVRLTTVSILANLAYWVVNLTVILAALTALGLGSATELFNRLVLYIPNVIAAVIVLILGSLFAQFLGTLTRTYLANLGVDGAEAIGNLARVAVVVFVVAVGLEQLSIGGQVLVSAFQIAFGAFCLALALAFGLGGREWAARVLDNIFGKH